MSRRPDARRAAVQCLGEVLDQQRALAEVRCLDTLKDARDRAFALHLSYGVLRWKNALEWLAGELLDKPLKASERQLQRLVLIGLYQLWQEDTADHAAVHATAETARGLGKPWAVGLVNAVLRRFQRERETLLASLAQTEARFAHPEWLLDRLRGDWPGDWQTIIEANNAHAPLWLRANLLQGGLQAAEQLLQSGGFTTRRHPLAPAALALTPPAPVHEIPGFTAGRFSVQDAAAQLAAELLDPQPGQRVLDACAAPGGKTGHLLEREPTIELTALDLSGARLERVRENLDRLGLKAALLAADAAEPDQWWDGKPFARILLDAPCSATGVIRRHPEIKWLRSPEQVTEACRTQARLLQRLWPLLEPGGILVYATCSVLRCENQAQIDAFLDANADATCIGPEDMGRTSGPGRQFLPGDSDGDGFYYAVLRKTPA